VKGALWPSNATK